MKALLLFAGLPYTGKTTLIRSLAERFPGSMIHADEIYNSRVPAAERCLEGWLREGPALARGIIERLESEGAPRAYVEVGIMRRKDRETILDWARGQGCRTVPILLSCHDEDEILARFRARQAAVEDDATIRIGLGELYERIRAAFEVPAPSDGFLVLDTTSPIEVCAARAARYAGWDAEPSPD